MAHRKPYRWLHHRLHLPWPEGPSGDVRRTHEKKTGQRSTKPATITTRRAARVPILNYTTTIDVSKTMGEIQSALARRGVTRISTLYDEAGLAAGLAFTMKTDYGLRDFELPVRTDGDLPP